MLTIRYDGDVIATKDIILNVQYGRKINFKERKAIKRLIHIYKNNKFIIDDGNQEIFMTK